MPHIDLTIPIAILITAFVIVLLVRAYAAWGDRRMEERTDAFLAGDSDEEPDPTKPDDVQP